MNFGANLTGAFGQSQALYDVRNDWKRGRGASKEDVDRQILADTQDIIGLQREAGLDYVMDPMFKILYLFQPLTEGVKGISVGPQENYFSNNIFYRRLQINGPLEIQTGFTERFLHLDELPKDGGAMAILPSPYTLLMLSDVRGYGNQEDAITNLANLLRAEAQDLVSKGIGRIQYDEPAIVVKQSLSSIGLKDLMLLDRGMHICGDISGATTSLNTYFGDAGPIIPYLLELHVNCIGIDCTETSLREISKYKFRGKELALGLLDARNTSIEDAKTLEGYLREMERKTLSERLFVTPNTGTEYRGFTHGKAKLELLAQVRRKLNG